MKYLLPLIFVGCAAKEPATTHNRDASAIFADVTRHDAFALRAPASSAWQQLPTMQDSLPARADGALRLGRGPAWLTVSPIVARASEGERISGAVVMRDVSPDEHMVLMQQGARIEELRVLYRPLARWVGRWRLAHGTAIATIAIEDGRVRARTAAGALVVESAPMFALDRVGTRRSVDVHLEGDLLVAALDTRGLHAPIVVDPLWTLGPAFPDAMNPWLAGSLGDGSVFATESVYPTYFGSRLDVGATSWVKSSLTPSGLSLPVIQMAPVKPGKVVIGEDQFVVTYTRATNAWAFYGLVTRRYDAALAVLSGERTILAGGRATSSVVSAVDLCDLSVTPGTGFGACTALAPMLGVRSAAKAFVLPGEKLLVAGGSNNYATSEPIATTEIYDIKSNSWSVGPPMSSARVGACAVALKTGKMLIVGGRDNTSGFTASSTAELYDPATNKWTTTGAMALRRSECSAVELETGKVLVHGGTDPVAGAVRSPELFDPITTTFLPTKGAPTDAGGKLVLMGDGSVVAVQEIGGGPIWRFKQYDKGATCTGDWDCKSGACADGVCCDKACKGACEFCNDTVSVGTCSTISGAPKSGHPTCAPYLCTAGACAASCTADSSCSPGTFCVGGKCIGRRNIGETCSVAAECTSGFCADGVCCTTACNGQCEACDVIASEGTCSPVAGVPHGKRVACSAGADACAARTCDGTKDTMSCVGYLRGAETPCGAATCNEASFTPVGTCSGMGACLPSPTTSCVPYKCDGKGCKLRCDVDSDCTAGFGCIANECKTKGATCSDDHLTSRTKGDEIIRCAPYLCVEPGGNCGSSCKSSAECAPGSLCDTTTSLCAPPTPSDDSGGCAFSTPTRTSSVWLIALIAGVAGVAGIAGARRRSVRARAR